MLLQFKSETEIAGGVNVGLQKMNAMGGATLPLRHKLGGEDDSRRTLTQAATVYRIVASQSHCERCQHPANTLARLLLL